MQNKRMMVMPPIYRFELRGRPKESKWGWHRAVELVEAINNILVLTGRSSMAPGEINEKFPFVRLNRYDSNNFYPAQHPSPVVSADFPYGSSMVGEVKWLETLVRGDDYLPAKIGMELIDAVKNPIRSSMKRMFTSKMKVGMGGSVRWS